MLDGSDPFEHLKPSVVRLPDGEVRRLIAEVVGSELPRPMDNILRVRDLTVLPFEAWARVLHPLQVPGPARHVRYSRWGNLFAGETPHIGGETSLREFLASYGNLRKEQSIGVEPLIGSLDAETVRQLAQFLLPYSENQAALFYFWGGLNLAAEQTTAIYRGALTWVDRFFAGGGIFFQSPNAWWPADRSWLVATHVDSTSTYVGGAQSLIEGLVTNQSLETIRVSELTAMDQW